MTDEDKGSRSWKNNLSLLVMVATAVTITAAFIVLGFVIDNTVTDTVGGLARERNLETARAIQNEVYNFLQETEQTLESAVVEYGDDLADEHDFVFHLRDFVDRDVGEVYDEINSVMFMDPEGNFHSLPEEEADFSPEEEWFTRAYQDEEIYYSERAVSPLTDEDVIRISFPVRDNAEQGEIIGVFAAEIDLDFMMNFVEEEEVGDEGYSYLVDRAGSVIAHYDRDVFLEGLNITELFEAQEALTAEEGSLQYTDQQGVDQVASYVSLPGIEGAVLVNEPADSVYRAAGSVRRQITFVGAGAVIIVLTGLYFFFKSQIIKRLKSLETNIDDLAAGNLDVDIEIKRSDVIGSISASFQEMAERLSQLIRKEKDMTENLASSSQELSASSEEMSASAEEVSTAIQEVASGAEEQSAQIDETQESMRELSQEIDSINEESDDMADIADQTATSVDEGRKMMDESLEELNEARKTRDKIDELTDELVELSDEIDEVIDFISSIAEQTNLLALNASIEAARAGQAGQGFSVVAEEIRELSENTANSTEDIAGLISKVQDRIKRMNDEMNKADRAMENSGQKLEESEDKYEEIENITDTLKQKIKDINESIEKMTANSSEIAAAMQEIAAVSEEASENAEKVAAASEEQTSNTEEVVQASEEMEKMAQDLEDITDQFEL